ncbi:MAG TPA: hypothetical protein VNA32_03690 [Actinomycetota bacterium]|nr:hypothetical protein [Actinomycetota bacterium]
MADQGLDPASALRIDDVPEPAALTILPDRPTPPWFGVPDIAQFAEQARRSADDDFEVEVATAAIPVVGEEMEQAEAEVAAAEARLYALRLRWGG